MSSDINRAIQTVKDMSRDIRKVTKITKHIGKKSKATLKWSRELWLTGKMPDGICSKCSSGAILKYGLCPDCRRDAERKMNYEKAKTGKTQR